MAAREHAEARDELLRAQVAEFEREDATDVAEEADLLAKAAVVERRRVTRLRQFEDRTGGRQYPHETGLWPELDEAADDQSRLLRWLAWARAHRGYSR